MHELSLASSLIEAAVVEARTHEGHSITGIRCRIGRLRQIDSRLFREAFDIAKAGTIASNAWLDLVYTPILLECSVCGLSVELEEWRFDCPKCGEPRITLNGGDEAELTSMDLEVEVADAD